MPVIDRPCEVLYHVDGTRDITTQRGAASASRGTPSMSRGTSVGPFVPRLTNNVGGKKSKEVET